MSETDGVGPGLLGGVLQPSGSGVAFLKTSASAVVAELLRIHGRSCDVSEVNTFPASISALDPMEAPWTVELVIACGEWTAYLNNAIGGTDLSACAPAVARALNVDLVTAQHAPMHGPGHAATQLWLQGPTGKPPLMSIRTLSAHCQDGRWSWHESGDVQPFEEPTRYGERRIRDRLDRELLVAYLERIGIHVDDSAFFGPGVAIRQIVDWSIRSEPVEVWSAEN